MKTFASMGGGSDDARPDASMGRRRVSRPRTVRYFHSGRPMIQRRAYIKRSRPARAAVGQVPRKGLARHVRVRVRNPKRHASNWKRAYGSAARVSWVKDQPCVACGGEPPPRCVNAHTRTGGRGRKADAATVIPLCLTCDRLATNKGWGALLLGDRRMTMADVRMWLAEKAAETEQRWQHFAESTPSGAR